MATKAKEKAKKEVKEIKEEKKTTKNQLPKNQKSSIKEKGWGFFF